jgi:glycosyltransferase involved in cell wall biosynthesis
MNVGGTATYLANLIDGLEKNGVENLLVMGDVATGESEDSVVSTLNYQRVEQLSRELNFSKDRRAKTEIEDAIAKFRPHLIHTHTFKAGFLVRLTKRDIPVIHSFHGHHLYDPEFGFIKRNVLNLIERRLAPRTRAFITIGKRVRDELLAVGIGSPDQYVPIAPGITPLEKVDSREIRKKFGFGDQEKLVIWLGRFTQVKRPDRVIEMALLMPHIRFVMAGGGEMLEKTKVKAPTNVSFVGFQDKSEMWSIADIGLCTSDSEGMPLSLIEAQMAGVPVVSTDVGSVSEIIDDGVTGRLCEKDHEDLVKKLQAVLDTMEHGYEMSKAARMRAEREFTREVMTEAHMNLYRKVLGKVEQ